MKSKTHAFTKRSATCGRSQSTLPTQNNKSTYDTCHTGKTISFEHCV